MPIMRMRVAVTVVSTLTERRIYIYEDILETVSLLPASKQVKIFFKAHLPGVVFLLSHIAKYMKKILYN